MPIPITLPRLGWTMDEGVFEGWLKRDGETVQAGDALFALEGEKATQDIEAIDNGILRIPPNGPKPGDVLPVGTVLAYLFAPDETPAWENRRDQNEFEESLDSPNQNSVAATEITPPRVPSRSTRTYAGAMTGSTSQRATSALTISPRALRAARELAVDWTKIRGTGRTGRIRERDVLDYAERDRTADHLQSASPSSPAPSQQGEHMIVFSQLRKTITARLHAAIEFAIPVTLVTEIDATNLVEMRDSLRQHDRAPEADRELSHSHDAAYESTQNQPIPTYTDFIVMFTAKALEQHPLLMAQWTEQGLLMPNGIHINIAIDTEAGLVAPLIRDVPRLSLRQLAESMRMLTALAHARRLSVDQSASGTFTVSNLGMFGIDAFTPILNIPQSAILGVGRIRRVPAVVHDQIVPRDRITLSLTFDHRVVDGAPAARFLDTLRKLIENPRSIEGSK